MSKIIKIYSVFFTALVLFSGAAFSQTNAVEIPDSALGNIVREWIAVVNEGDEARLRAFIENKFSGAALKRQTPESLFTLFRNLQKQGGIEIVRLKPETGELPMSLVIKSGSGNHYASVIVGLNKAEGKLAGIGIRKTENPSAENWSQNALSDAEMIQEIRRRVAERAGRGDFSGVVLVARDDRILLHEAHGEADREAKIPNTIKTRFHLASVGKTFTSAAIATLVRAGKISYTDTVAKILPDYPNQEIARRVTIHQLLTHSAGMGTFFESPGFDPRAKYRDAAAEIPVYANEPLFFEPGTKWRYSNAGYSLLGAIIERVSGKTYLEYVRENVFKPLKMDETGVDQPDMAARGGAILYQPTDVDPFGLETFRADRGILRSNATGFGGGFSSATDLYKFLRAYRTGKLLGRGLTEVVVAPKVFEQTNRNWGYGIVESRVNGETVRGHSGGGRADVAILWNSGYIVIVLVNVVPPTANDLGGKIINFITRQEALRRETKK